MLVIFAGAGASMAVGKQYPTTVKFFEELPDWIEQDKLFQQAVAWIKQSKGPEGVVDIEEVLWVLGELKTFLGKAANSDSLVRWFLDGNRLTNVLGVGENSSQIPALATQGLTRIANVMSQINRRVYDLYDATPDEPALSQNWLALLRFVPRPFQVFTTNYDRVIEETIRLSGTKCETGRVGGATNPRLDLSTWTRAIPGARPSLLTKLHGSVDWVRKPDGTIYVGTPMYSGDHERHVILYPGFKGEPANEPFGMFHRHLATCLTEAAEVLFIGFAFRDEYINRLIRENIPGSCRIVVLDPQDSMVLPFSAQASVTHIRGYFDSGGVDKVRSALGWPNPPRSS